MRRWRQALRKDDAEQPQSGEILLSLLRRLRHALAQDEQNTGNDRVHGARSSDEFYPAPGSRFRAIDGRSCP